MALWYITLCGSEKSQFTNLLCIKLLFLLSVLNLPLNNSVAKCSHTWRKESQKKQLECAWNAKQVFSHKTMALCIINGACTLVSVETKQGNKIQKLGRSERWWFAETYLDWTELPKLRCDMQIQSFNRIFALKKIPRKSLLWNSFASECPAVAPVKRKTELSHWGILWSRRRTMTLTVCVPN